MPGCGGDDSPAASDDPNCKLFGPDHFKCRDSGTSDAGGTDATSGVGAVDGAMSADTSQPPNAVCHKAGSWKKGMAAFKEITSAWGLDGVAGIRISVLDYDGDGRPDVLVRRNEGPDDFADSTTRRRWLLRNTGAGFVDMTQKSGLFTSRKSATQGALKGSVMASGDVDNDGDLDIFIARTVHNPADKDYDGETSELLLNKGDGTFELGPGGDARNVGKPAVPAGVTFVDYDRDGLLDLWVTHNMVSKQTSPLQDRIYKGDGKGGFKDVTAQLKMLTKAWSNPAQMDAGLAHSWAWSSAACDLNNDGVPELLASSYGRAPNHLWRGLEIGGALHYVNESVASGYAYDHRQDWTTNVNAQCYCYDNPKAAGCNTCPKPKNLGLCAQLKAAFGGKYRWQHQWDRSKFRLGGNSGATVCADINNDGFIDLLTGEIVHPDVGETSDPTEIMVNAKATEVRFERPGNDKTGLLREHKGDVGDMANAVLDFDNDGWPDIYIGSSDYPGTTGLLFHQKAPPKPGIPKFEAVEYGDYFKHNRSAGVVAADFDLDGDLDLLVGHSRMRCNKGLGADCYPTLQVKLFENVVGARAKDGIGNWLRLTLEGGPGKDGKSGSNRSAIGARVEVKAAGVLQTQEVDGGHGHFNSQKDKSLHFGLGGCEAKVTIYWPDKTRTEQSLTLHANRHYRIKQGEKAVVVAQP